MYSRIKDKLDTENYKGTGVYGKNNGFTSKFDI